MNALIMLNIVGITVSRLNKSCVIKAFVKNAVLTEAVNSGKLFVGIEQCANSGRAVAVLVKVICLSVNNYPFCKIFIVCAVVIVRSVIILHSDAVIVPYAGNKLSVFLKRVGYGSVVIGFNACKRGCIEIVPLIIYHNPAAGKDAEL